MRYDVAVPHSGHRHHGPVNRLRNAGESVFFTLDQIHHGADYEQERDDRTEEDDDFAGAGAQRRPEHRRLSHEVGELQHPKHSQQSQRPDDDQRLCPGEDQAEIGGNDGEQIYHTEKARRVA